MRANETKTRGGVDASWQFEHRHFKPARNHQTNSGEKMGFTPEPPRAQPVMTTQPSTQKSERALGQA